MNEDGSPASNTSVVPQIRAINSCLDGVVPTADNVPLHFSQQLFVSTKATTQSENDLNNNVSNNRSSSNNSTIPIMTNGRVLCSPIVIQQQQQQQQQQQLQNVTGANVLRQIIANDVHSPSNVKVTNMNSRHMVVKTAPHGAVQITYRKMIHSLPEYKKPIAILPKPPTPVQKCSPKPVTLVAASPSQYLSNSDVGVESPRKLLNGEHSRQLPDVNNCRSNNNHISRTSLFSTIKNHPNNSSISNNHDNNVINILMNGENDMNKIKNCNNTKLTTNNNGSTNTMPMNRNMSNDDLLSSLLSAKSSSLCVLPLTTVDGGSNTKETVIHPCQGRGSTTVAPSDQSHVPVLGSSKNLNLSFPKMDRISLFSPVQSTGSADDEIVSNNYKRYSVTSHEDMEQTSDQFDSSFEMEDVSQFISSSANNSNNISYNGSISNQSFITPPSNGTTNSYSRPDLNETFLATNNNVDVNCSGTITNRHVTDAQDIDMDLLSMDIDSLDSITMNTFLQNGTLFHSEESTNFCLKETGNNSSSNNKSCTNNNDKSSSSNINNYTDASGQLITLSSNILSMLPVNSSVPDNRINCSSIAIDNSSTMNTINNCGSSSNHCNAINTINNCINNNTSIGSTINNNINDATSSNSFTLNNDLNNNSCNNNINTNNSISISKNSSPFTLPNSQSDYSREAVSCSLRSDLHKTSESAGSYSTSSQKAKQLNVIADVSPDTSTTLGGSKIILIGSWNAKDSRYLCQFGEDTVDAELIQNGVLRCYSPKTSPGKIMLSVLCDNQLSSNEVEFLIVNPSDTTEDKSIKHNSWLSITKRSLLLLLIERITAIAEIIGIKGITNLKEISTEVGDDSQELKVCQERLVAICKKLMVEKVNFSFDYNVENTMTVLHLAAALGFTKFIQLLLKWVETNPNKLIMAEACPTHYDQFSLLPIMWSSAKGHFNTTCVLHQWVEVTIEKCDACGCTAIDLAKECGHETIAEYLERLQKKVHTTNRDGSRQATEETIESSSCESQMLISNTSACSSPNSNSSGCTSKTLGKTLAQIQSMISDQDDGYLQEELTLDGEELFETSPFSLRQGSLSSEEKSPASIHSHRSPSSTSSPAPQSPFDRQAFQTAEFCEFFYKAKKIEKDFAELTLTDEEQEDLLRAANVIQLAYKTYKERRNRREQEFNAAVLIQSYYRRYKQYAAFKKMQKGAVIIQNQYRAHREKAKKKVKAATTIQTYYRRYRERKNSGQEDLHVRNKLQQQEDRRMNRYLKQTSTRFSREFPDNLLLGGNVSTSSSSSTSPDLQHGI